MENYLKRPKIALKNLGYAHWAKTALAKGRSPPQDLEEGQHGGLYLLVMSNNTQGLHSANLELPGDCCLFNT